MWGVDSPKELEVFGQGIIHTKTIYLTDDSAIERLPKSYRIMFRFVGRFKAAKEAHRIFVMQLAACTK